VSLEHQIQHPEHNQNAIKPDTEFSGENDLKSTTELRSGEKGFTILLLILCAFFLYQSVLLYRHNPGSDSCASLPLGVSILLTVLSLWNVLLNIKKKTPLNGVTAITKKVWGALVYIFPIDIFVMTSFIVLYCVMLRMGIGFYISTPLFLWGSMCYMVRKDYLKNLIWTALCMLFILLVFSELFNVVLP
jgi:hypothetical protein